jgi:hypothetical protein
MVSIKQQLFNALKNDAGNVALGVVWYGSEDDTAYMLPPPPQPGGLWAHVSFGDEFQALPGDTRAIVSVVVGDLENRQYARINRVLARCGVVLARRPETQYVDSDTTEMYYFPEPAGLGPETEDPDRPGYLQRFGEWQFRKVIGAAAVVSGA